ncbi:hypothetical protein EH31_13525 [Erythrobacter longus]|uniref:Uncharacterized protein n=1 Tax=Erythrobacter longus TaxID=1044 RepID=A0A074M8G5_ERYLO|nr:ACT domain-containing protein [Erythrobacter longus]KEO89055.1 hypothetical protein EH31_13525 [Erythrobacter longus]
MTTGPVSDLHAMLAGMEPAMLDDHGWQFVEGTSEGAEAQAFAVIREAEGATLVVKADRAKEAASFARITLQVHSALDGVGLSAAVSTALAEAGIACNVIAAFHHDHLFVPWGCREEAMAILKGLSEKAQG